MKERDSTSKSGVDITVLKGHEFKHQREILLANTQLHLTPNEQGTSFYARNTARFEQSSIAEPKGPVITVTAHENNASINGSQGEQGSILQRIAWKAKQFHPIDTELKVTNRHNNQWSINVGDNPHLPSTITFGQEQPEMSITFAGHVDTLVRSIIEEYPDNNDLRTLAVSFVEKQHTRDEDEIDHWRTICTPTHLHGQFKYIEYDTRINERRSFTYSAQGLAYVEIQKATQKKKDLPYASIRLSVATIADTDQKLRAYHTRWQSLSLNGREKMNKTQRSALCMEYAHIIELLSYTDISESPFPLDSFEFLDVPINEAPDAHEFIESQDRFKTITKVLPKLKKSKRK